MGGLPLMESKKMIEKYRKLFSLFIFDDQLTGLSVFFLVVVGLAVMYLSLYFFHNYNLRIIGMSLGLAITSIGGYSARASTLRSKPFDTTYTKARESYEKEKDES